jgi:hypothetical protein
MHIRLFLGDCDVVVQCCWVLLFDPKENECLSSCDVAVLKPTLNHVVERLRQDSCHCFIRVMLQSFLQVRRDYVALDNFQYAHVLVETP